MSTALNNEIFQEGQKYITAVRNIGMKVHVKVRSNKIYIDGHPFNLETVKAMRERIEARGE